MKKRLGQKRPTARGGGFALAVCLTSLVVAAGCFRTRGFYHGQADADAYYLIDQKASDPRWSLPDYSVYPSPESRMADPNSQDFPPQPLDDPTSNELMYFVDGKKNYQKWTKNGVIASVENPAWLAYLPMNEDGTLTLNDDRVVELARLNSRDYQTELEDLYLSALDVSFQRFRFDAQFFGGYETIFTADGPQRSGVTSSSELQANTRNIQMEKLFASGGELVVGFANQLVWEFSGPNTHSVNSLIDFSLVQPLLRGGGRRVVLEQLTQSERDLLANVRQMERYQRGFYLEIVAGRSAGPGPGAGGVGFPSIGSSGSFSASGYMGLLQTEQNIRNQEANIAGLRSSLTQLESFFEAGRIDSFQVELTRQALFREQSSLLSNRASFANRLDLYKIELGLPPELPVNLDVDPFFNQFNLIEPAFTRVQNQLTDLQVALGESIIGMLPDPTVVELDPLQQLQPELVWDEQAEATFAGILANLRQIQELRSRVAGEFAPLVGSDVNALREMLPQRVAELQDIQQQLVQYGNQNGQPTTQESVTNGVLSTGRLSRLPDQLDAIQVDLNEDFVTHGESLDKLIIDIEKLMADAPNLTPQQLYARAQQEVFGQAPSEISALIADVLSLSLVQARARTESITLTQVDISAEEALDIARMNRRDWMNAQAALVDSWRQVGFFANDLEADLDVVFSGDIGTLGKNPVKFNSDNGRLRVGLQWDAPVTRLIERNNYRESQIAYERTRRQYYAFRDLVSRGLRDTIRTIDVNKINFELRRAAVQVAISQVERTQLRLQEPSKPNQDQQKFDSSTARDLINALDSLLSAQNDFLGVAVNYEVLRRSLDLDMGTMQLDSRGIWIDPGPLDSAAWRSRSDHLTGEGEMIETPPAEGEIPEDQLQNPADPGPFEALPPELRAPLPAQEDGILNDVVPPPSGD
ncbi:hypothetical protein [Blastopirellula marina]|uniref:Outer membrane efflux protein n=1 Tax=Blastopirellula marina TaxID=124 RepID=A0A2S8FF66_9BACT|nr:hypothetical protein [Blastopirellula marina]PQO30821.1 hypothetical protein C5Y98_20720 [Blastopirellula marina]PTL42674.1 hypothetical protein C5Y97_20730 [Blastopirellula marina]